MKTENLKKGMKLKMMNNAKVTIINLERQNFSNKETGEVKYMTKVMYAIKMDSNENFKGNAILRAYCNAEAFEKLEKMLMTPVTAEIEQRATEDGAKYYISKVNDIIVR